MAINPAYLTPEQFADLITVYRSCFIFEGIVFVIISIAAVSRKLDRLSQEIAAELGG